MKAAKRLEIDAIQVAAAALYYPLVCNPELPFNLAACGSDYISKSHRGYVRFTICSWIIW